ncbi:Proteasome subunit beta type-4 [Podila epicladia]|uniref:Proteasome subunit beta n=1 Tax=Podila minutissima TaxID=64525 RepID=A0A9P5SGD2_9FUNG|nr:Proteasome subunit beta type-4 [Haplosporangium bisporale]KAF9215899.1 Proteasome subunit beta type-4 [Podila verticillata]KAF9328900.1 Proteasome subunit beta type-4 [Podila minutissima]KAG0075877.1 Proteasome subunit beta type-4 [Podila epicladia]KAI9234833.1 MAG: nucleophile aminohydrolase [Podila humilis]KFH69645.1 20S proteasome subunit beta 4 [Podila verticillata NRRL 6337]
MDTLFGITGKDFAITAYDSKAVASITLMKIGEDKSRELNPHTLMLFSGEPGDGVHFSEYIERNIKLYGIRHGIEMSPRAVASFARRELADSLRSRKPYSVNLLIAGFDVKTNTPSIFWLDHLASLADVPFAAHGYGAYYCLSLLDRYHRPDITEEEGIKLLQKCVGELRSRMIINMPDFVAKVVNKDGIRIVKL